MLPTTWNPSDKDSSISLSGGNLVTTKTADQTGGVRSIFSASSGKYYWEITCGVAGAFTRFVIGIEKTGATALINDVGQVATDYGYRGQSGKKVHGQDDSTGTAYGDTYTTGDVIGVALDLDNGKIWFSKNGTWQASGDPATGINAAFTGISGTYFAAVSSQYTSSSTTVNFGGTGFAYTVPVGFTPGFGNPIVINSILPKFGAILTASSPAGHGLIYSTLPLFQSALHANVSNISPQPAVNLLGALPVIQGQLFGGGIARLNLSLSSFASVGRVGISGSLSAPLIISLSASSSVAISGSLSALLNVLSLSPTGLTGVIGQSTLLLFPSFSATGLVGLLGILDLTISRSSDLFSAAISPHGDGTFSLHIGFGATGTYQSSFRSMVLNLKNNGLTEYLNYNFNSMTTFNGSAFGANSNGIYELTGTTDAGSNISWRVRYPRLDLETDGIRKILRYAWLGIKASGDLTLSVRQANGTVYDYTMEQISTIDDGIRVKFGKGIKSRYVDVELRNIANESAVIDKVRIFIEPTGKKR